MRWSAGGSYGQSGPPERDFLVDANQQSERRLAMTRNCRICPKPSWIDGHFRRYENRQVNANAAVPEATRMRQLICPAELADPGRSCDEDVAPR